MAFKSELLLLNDFNENRPRIALLSHQWRNNIKLEMLLVGYRGGRVDCGAY